MAVWVNGDLVTDEAIQYELNRLIKLYSEFLSEPEIRKQLDALRKKAKDQAVGAKLLMDEARKLDIPVPHEDIEAKLNELIRQAGGEDAFQRLLKQQGLSRERVMQSIEQGIKVDRLVEQIVAGAPDPTEEQIREHYEKHLEEYRIPEKANARHILVRTDGTAEGRDAARAKLEEIRERLDAGEDFAELAAAYSDCPSGRTTGGSLGWIQKGTMVEALDKALFDMEVGARSDIVESPLGLHLLEKVAAEESRPAPFEEVREKIRDFLRHVSRGNAIAAYVEELKAKADIRDA